jgi:HEAT repeat protein
MLTASEPIDALVGQLGSRQWRVRRDARLALEQMGSQAIPYLTPAATAPDDQVRWEALKILGATANPAVVPVLVDALSNDRNAGNRWVAADALSNLGYAGLRPLLRALVEHSELVFLRAGAHHVLKVLARDGLHSLLAPVLAALDGIEPALVVPIEAHRALEALDAGSH